MRTNRAESDEFALIDTFLMLYFFRMVTLSLNLVT